MLKMLADENFNGDVVSGLLARRPDLDLVRVQDVGLAGTEDPAILAWAATNDRILLTHDKATVPDLANARVSAGEAMPGVFVAARVTVREIIEDLIILDTASEEGEWVNRVLYLPL